MNTILWGNVNVNLLSISGLTAVDRTQRNALFSNKFDAFAVFNIVNSHY